KSTVSRIIQRSKENKDMAVPSVPPSQPTTSGTMGQDGTIREVKQAELFAGQENGEGKP
ncbi:helicase, partial [Bacteroides fragilis]|nr:helicase [Bacteroides fragilis]